MRMLWLFSLLLTGWAHARSLPFRELTAGFHRIEAEVAHTPETRARGLMHRREMAPQRGMLFVFAADAQHCMWMKNTLLPLSVAFLDAAGRILNVAEMKPHSEENHCAARPARYALEMNAGWFAQRGIRPGDVIGGLERAPQGH
jgi:uncharacterized protein